MWKLAKDLKEGDYVPYQSGGERESLNLAKRVSKVEAITNMVGIVCVCFDDAGCVFVPMKTAVQIVAVSPEGTLEVE